MIFRAYAFLVIIHIHKQDPLKQGLKLPVLYYMFLMSIKFISKIH